MLLGPSVVSLMGELLELFLLLRQWSLTTNWEAMAILDSV